LNLYFNLMGTTKKVAPGPEFLSNSVCKYQVSNNSNNYNISHNMVFRDAWLLRLLIRENYIKTTSRIWVVVVLFILYFYVTLYRNLYNNTQWNLKYKIWFICICSLNPRLLPPSYKCIKINIKFIPSSSRLSSLV